LKPTTACNGTESYSVNLPGPVGDPCDQSTFDSLCAMGLANSKHAADSSCSVQSISTSDPFFCLGQSTNSICMTAALSTLPGLCTYTISRSYKGSCSQISNPSCSDGTCGGTFNKTVVDVPANLCYDGSPAVVDYCDKAMKIARFEANSICDPESENSNCGWYVNL
jgi:hypothetical protein